MSEPIHKASIFKTEVTIERDGTCYGNKYSLQLEDSETEDHEFLATLRGKTFKATIILEEAE